MLAILFDTLVLSALLWIFARHEAENNFSYNILVAAIIGIVGLVLGLALGILGILLLFPFTAWLLTTGLVCLQWRTAFLVAGIFLVYRVALTFAFAGANSP